MSPVRVGAILLAAGASRRMGVPKQLLGYGGQSLLRRAAEAALGSGARRVVAVLGADAGLLEPELAGLAVEVVVNPLWAEGMSTSLRAGLEALQAGPEPPPEAVLLVLCDQPHVDARFLGRLVALQAREGAGIVASEYAGTVGVPALFAARFFPELAALAGDRGARQILLRHPGEVRLVEFPLGAVDVDTPEDYERLGRETGLGP